MMTMIEGHCLSYSLKRRGEMITSQEYTAVALRPDV